jgi:ATP-dependent Clp protease ATP-binding subunit ClpC
MTDDYANALAQDGRDLVAAARDGELPSVDFRDEDVQAVLDLLDKGRSVLLVGPDGVGKTAIVHGVAKAMSARNVGDLVELSTTAVMSGTRYLGEWQSKATSIARKAAEFGTVVYLSDVWNLPKTGRSDNNDNNLLDALRPFVGAGKMTLLAEVSPEVLRLMERHAGFVPLFTKVPVAPLDEAAVDRCLQHAAKRKGFELDAAGRRTLKLLTSRFLPARPQPGPALDLLTQVRDYQLEKQGVGEHEPISPTLIERVFSIYSGLPMFVVSASATMPAKEIRAWFEDRIVGQREAIEAVVEAIALFKAGLNDPTKPLGTFLFVGPTGVGKTEVARALARFLFGSESRLLRFDLSEFKDYHSFEILVGNPKDPGRPAALIDPVRAQPFQVVLLDELEKAHSNVWDLLLGVLDEGRLTPPGGKTVDFRSTILIATSNVGARGTDKRFGFAPDTSTGARRHAVTKSLENHFRPEFLNRFQNLVVFHALSKDQVKQVARWELKRILKRDGIAARNLVVEVTDEALDQVIERGFDPRYGARALKREIQRQLVLPLAMALMEQQVADGSILKIVENDGHIRVRVLETREIRAKKAELAPVKAENEVLTREDVGERLEMARARLERIAGDLGEENLHAQRRRLEQARVQPAFWSQPEAAARDLRDLDRIASVLDRLDRLRSWNEELLEDLARTRARARIEKLARDLLRQERALVRGERELLRMGFDGAWDALVEVRPLGAGGRKARDLLVQTYIGWAAGRKMQAQWLRDPQRADEAAMLAVKGHYAVGLLMGEAGLHRVRDGKDSAVCRVRVAPWTDADGEVGFIDHRALKGKQGQLGGRIRSRLECKGGLVLQNGCNLSENRELAAAVAPSWAQVGPASDEQVRRIDLAKPLLKDASGFSSGRKDALAPGPFHELLCHRVDSRL